MSLEKRQLVSNSCFRIEKDSIQYDEDNFNEKEDSISSDDNYEDDRPDFNSQTQLHVTFAGAKVLNRKGNKLQNLNPEKKYHNFRYACEEKTSRCFFTNKTAGTKINNTTSKASCKRITKTWSREQKYHNFRYACEEKTCRCFTNKTTGTKISITTRQHYYSLATSNRL